MNLRQVMQDGIKREKKWLVRENIRARLAGTEMKWLLIDHDFVTQIVPPAPGRAKGKWLRAES